ncbi:MAG: HlyC/CorC family transporter [Bauldia sp.]|nr:HlyC/CorC family transporter [Bauldia sp.]
MNDRKDTPLAGVEPAPEPLPSSPPPGARPGEGDTWLDRLRGAVGLRSATAREELEEALEEASTDDAFTPEERAMLSNVLGLREVRVEDIMVPRADVEAVDIDATLGELMAEFRENGHSRMPVYRDSLDEPVGMVHIKDLMLYLAKTAAVPSRNDARPAVDLSRVDLSRTVGEAGLVRNVLFVPASMPVAKLLTTMQTSRMQMALVIDEFGGTDGVVSIEDAVEAIVGEIEDEHDEDEPEIAPDGDGAFVADGGAGVEEVAAAVGGDLGKDRDEDEVETIGGLVFSLLGRIPATGETIIVPGGYEVRILDADQRRIRRLRIERLAALPGTPATAPGAEGTEPRTASRA